MGGAKSSILLCDLWQSSVDDGEGTRAGQSECVCRGKTCLLDHMLLGNERVQNPMWESQSPRR